MFRGCRVRPAASFFDNGARVLWRKPMRRLILPGALALALAACGSNQQANNAAVSDESGAGDITAVNDTTAIDAATGEAANMAADVNYTFNEQATNGADNTTSTRAPTRSTKKSAPTAQPDEPGTANNISG
jgi:hypothetical protein